jgi:hypothetical protein
MSRERLDDVITWQNEPRTEKTTIMTLLFADDQAVITEHEDSLQRAFYT